MPLNQTAHQILDIAENKIRTDGFNAFSYKDLAKEVGIKTSSIHYYFPTKQDLALALMVRTTDRWRQYLSDISTDHKKGLKRLEVLADLYVSDIKHNKLSLAAMLAFEQSSLNESVILEIQEFFLIIEMWVVQVLSQALEAKQIRADINPHKLACLFVSIIEGASLINRLSSHKEYFKEIINQYFHTIK